MFKQCPLCKGNHFERVGLFGDQFILCRLCSGKDHVNVVMGEKKPIQNTGHWILNRLGAEHEKKNMWILRLLVSY